MDGLAIVGSIIVISTVVLALVCFILYAHIQRKRHYRCPHCGQRFKSPPIKSFTAASSGADKRLTCPNCGAVDYMEFQHDDEYDPANDEPKKQQNDEEDAG